MDLGKVDKTFEGLKDLILREQFLAVSGKNLVMFLKERKIKSVEEMSQIADQYIEAHGVGETMSKLSQVKLSEGTDESGTNNLNRTCGLESSNQPRLMRDRVCYNCGKKDHFIRDCLYKTNRKPGTTVKAAAVEITDNINTLSEKRAENVTAKHTEHQDNEKQSQQQHALLYLQTSTLI